MMDHHPDPLSAYPAPLPIPAHEDLDDPQPRLRLRTRRPLLRRPLKRPALPQPAAPALAVRPRVLVIDEDDRLLRAVRGALSQDGYLVETASSAFDGAQRALRFPPNLILLDVLMSQQDGLELFDTLRQHERTRLVPIVAASSLATRDAARILLEMGFAGLVKKPLDLGALRAELSRFLAPPSGQTH